MWAKDLVGNAPASWEGSAKHQTAKFLNHYGPAFVIVMLANGLAGVKGYVPKDQ